MTWKLEGLGYRVLENESMEIKINIIFNIKGTHQSGVYDLSMWPNPMDLLPRVNLWLAVDLVKHVMTS